MNWTARPPHGFVAERLLSMSCGLFPIRTILAHAIWVILSDLR
jgi:hypothetical protein